MEKTVLFLFLGASAAVMLLAAMWAVILKQVLDRLKLHHPSAFDQRGRLG